MNSRLAAALRFGLTLGVVDLSSLAIIGSGPATTSASFAVMAALYFLDYDGRARERLGAYSASIAVALVGIVIGAAVQGSTVASLIAAALIGFIFAVARAYRGFIARSFVGAQLGFVLAVFTDHSWAHVGDLTLGWVWGSLVSLVAALVIFPRHHSGKLRAALGDWCAAVARYIRADETSRELVKKDVMSALDRIDALDKGERIAGLWSKRTRALASMSLHVHQSTEFLTAVPPLSHIDSDQAALVEVTAEGFERASTMVRLGGKPAPLAPVLDARNREFDAERARILAGGETVDERREHARFDVRVLSMSAQSVQALAAASQGWAHPDLPIVVEPEHRIGSLARRTFRRDSIWLYHGLRTALALAGAIGIALAMGLEHGVWVVMTTLSVINVSFNTSASSRNAFTVMLGVIGGIAIAAGVLTVSGQQWMLAIAVPLLAFIAKWMLPANATLAQLTYTPLAVTNVALLGWPTTHGLTVVRLEDIAVGAAVAVVATALTFPFGMRRLLDMVWVSARTAADAAVAATRHALETATAIPPKVEREQHLTFASATDAIDTVYSGAARVGARMDELVARQRWLNLAILCQLGVAQLVERRLALADDDPGVPVLNQWATDALSALDKTRPALDKVGS